MQEQLNKPKRFGEILDTVFTLSRHRFLDFLKIFLIIVGPIYILQALIQLASGTSFFREVSVGSNWIEQVFNSFLDDEMMAVNVEEEIMMVILLLISLVFVVVAQVAVLYAIDHIRRGADFTVSEVIKKAFSKFWPLFRGGLLLMILAMVAIFVVGFIGVIFGLIIASISEVLAILAGIFMFVAFMVVFTFLMVRFSFYAGAIAFGDKAFSSLGSSWRLTSGRVWILIGIYLVFSVIIGTVNTMFELPVGLILGNSVLFGLIISGVTLVTTMISSVGYAVVYLDLYVRHDSTDLKDMIAEYDYRNE